VITQQDLQAAIAECIGERNPNANTCIKLAAYYTIQREMYGEETVSKMETPTYSFAPPPEQVETTIDYESNTEFGRAIAGRREAEVWPLIDELVETISVVNPRLYAGFMRKLEN
jgi:hypothetical protein